MNIVAAGGDRKRSVGRAVSWKSKVESGKVKDLEREAVFADVREWSCRCAGSVGRQMQKRFLPGDAILRRRNFVGVGARVRPKLARKIR